ncbi:hypothetical protein OKS68_01355 [Aeromonas veronii]|nr:hypothetical protein [Aeromonas veronii]
MAGGTQALLQKSMAGLEKLGSYACTDAQTFVQPNNPSYQKIIGKLNAFGQDPQRLAANQHVNNSANMAAIQITRNKQPLSLRTMENIAKAGCCSALAYSAAAELLRHNSDQRIEVLAHRGAQGHAQTHCFVVIGRAEGSELTKPESWGPHAKVVDPWAATIGAPLVGTPARPLSPTCGRPQSRSLITPIGRINDVPCHAINPRSPAIPAAGVPARRGAGSAGWPLQPPYSRAGSTGDPAYSAGGYPDPLPRRHGRLACAATRRDSEQSTLLWCREWLDKLDVELLIDLVSRMLHQAETLTQGTALAATELIEPAIEPAMSRPNCTIPTTIRA